MSPLQLKRFQDAFRGVRLLFREIHARFHALAAVIVVGAGWYFNVSAVEWCLLCLAIGSVFAAETFNTAIEELADKVEPQIDPTIRNVKDLAAGAVLWAAFAAFCIGLFVFLPKIV